jgi:hypothetical protein
MLEVSPAPGPALEGEGEEVAHSSSQDVLPFRGDPSDHGQETDHREYDDENYEPADEGAPPLEGPLGGRRESMLPGRKRPKPAF